MKNRYITAALFALAAILSCLCAAFQTGQQQLAEKMIRLHVVASSDAPEDQRMKLLVRDAVLQEAARALAEGGDPEASLRVHLPQMERAANETLRQLGSRNRAEISLRNELFPTREYETFRLPAGVYRTLRVTIGEGEGHNWWCVVYPALCLPASADGLEEVCLEAGLTQGEISVLTEDGGGIELEFRTLELLGKLKKLLWDA